MLGAALVRDVIDLEAQFVLGVSAVEGQPEVDQEVTGTGDEWVSKLVSEWIRFFSILYYTHKIFADLDLGYKTYLLLDTIESKRYLHFEGDLNRQAFREASSISSLFEFRVSSSSVIKHPSQFDHVMYD